jgi:uncharacterized membrane protein YfcA
MDAIFYGSLIIFSASFVQAVTGFGFALLAVPLLSIFFPLKGVVPLVVLFSLATNLMILKETSKYIRLKEIGLIIIFSIIGIPVGVSFLKLGNVDILKLLIGAIILITGMVMMTGSKLKIGNEAFSSGIIGFLSGFLNGSISIGGPPLVMYLTNKGDAKDTFRANLTACAIITNLVTISCFLISGGFDRKLIGNFMFLLPSLLAGIVTGILAVRKINEFLFRNLILILIMVTGVIVIITTIV